MASVKDNGDLKAVDHTGWDWQQSHLYAANILFFLSFINFQAMLLAEESGLEEFSKPRAASLPVKTGKGSLYMHVISKNYKLTTAEIIDLLPDYPNLLQTFVWQKIDSAPDFPLLHRFLDFWQTNLDGPIHSVRVAGRDLIAPVRIRNIDAQFLLH